MDGAWCLLFVLALPSCGGEQRGAPGSSSAQATPAELARPVAAVTREESPAAAEPPSSEPPSAAPIDLLRAVRADVAVSSVYRGDVSQAFHLVDGDLETAWSSRTGELAGAFVEVRLPPEVAVTSLAMTAGFTRARGDTDLFTGNHRVARVRVSRDGVEVGTYDLDPASRELQELPVIGPGGVYRVEVVELVAGSRSRWRETCISELRIHGHASEARPDERFPRLSVGSLPPPRAEPRSLDRAAVARQLEREVSSFTTGWRSLHRDVHRFAGWDGESPPPDEMRAFTRQRRSLLARIAALVEAVDEAAADSLRHRSMMPLPHATLGPRREEQLARDLDLVTEGVEAVVSWLDEPQARCVWSRAQISLRLQRVSTVIDRDRFGTELTIYQDGDSSRETRRLHGRLSTLEPLLQDLDRRFARESRALAARLRRLTLPDPSPARPDWERLQALLGIAEESCGWSGSR